MTTKTISAHPAAWNLAWQVVDQSPPGTTSSMRTAIRLLDAISEKVHPNDPWPDPWRPWTDEQRAEVERRLKHPVDPAARVEIALTDEQSELLKKMLNDYTAKAPTQHGRAVLMLLDALGG